MTDAETKDKVMAYLLVGTYFLGLFDGDDGWGIKSVYKKNAMRFILLFAWPLVVLFGLYLALKGKP